VVAEAAARAAVIAVVLEPCSEVAGRGWLAADWRSHPCIELVERRILALARNCSASSTAIVASVPSSLALGGIAGLDSFSSVIIGSSLRSY